MPLSARAPVTSDMTLVIRAFTWADRAVRNDGVPSGDLQGIVKYVNDGRLSRTFTPIGEFDRDEVVRRVATCVSAGCEIPQQIDNREVSL